MPSSASLKAIRRIAEVNRRHLHVTESLEASGLVTSGKFGEIEGKGRVADSFRRTRPCRRLVSKLPPKKGDGKWFGASPNRFGEPTNVAESLRLHLNKTFQILFFKVSIGVLRFSCQNIEFLWVCECLIKFGSWSLCLDSCQILQNQIFQKLKL